MKKRMIAMSVVAAAITMAMSIPAFAAGWEQDRDGWKYYTDGNGNFLSGQWFTDPADGSIYHLDPDGYMMTETHVEGYWLGTDGRRQDKTAEQERYEQELARRDNAKDSPAKQAEAASAAANTAKSGTMATSTTRREYQAEMTVFMDKIYRSAINSLVALEVDTNLIANTYKTNIHQSYVFETIDGAAILNSSIGFVTTTSSEDYRPYSFSITYNRGALDSDDYIQIFDTAFKDMTIAAAGDNAGAAAYNYLFEQLNAGNYSFEASNTTDTGNSYTMTCANGTVTLTVTCSEYTEAAAETETPAEETAAVTNQAAATAPATSSVITAGAGKNASATGTTSDSSEEDNDEEYDNEYEEDAE